MQCLMSLTINLRGFNFHLSNITTISSAEDHHNFTGDLKTRFHYRLHPQCNVEIQVEVDVYIYGTFHCVYHSTRTNVQSPYCPTRALIHCSV